MRRDFLRFGTRVWNCGQTRLPPPAGLFLPRTPYPRQAWPLDSGVGPRRQPCSAPRACHGPHGASLILPPMALLLSLRPGLTGTAEMIVGEQHTAPRIGSGRIHVLATPVMINLIESAALAAVEQS